MAKHALRRRLVLAAVLGVGYYLMVLVLAVVLAALPYLEVRYLGRLHFYLLGAPVVAVSLLWAAIPRRSQFTAPGPELVRSEHPALFAMIDELADELGERPPAHVYIEHSVNAFVTDARSLMGIGGTRVMGIGLPLLVALNVDELRAVLAHEFGHYSGGDTRFGGFLYGLRRSLVHSITKQGNNVVSSVLAIYHTVFVKATASISREQELAADRVAAEATSPQVTASALWRVAGAADLHEQYVTGELSAMVSYGRRPPWIEGFGRFVSARGGEAALRRAAARHLADTGHVFDTHPPLGERLAALGVADDGIEATQRTRTAGPLAISLLGEASAIRGVESQVADHALVDASNLQPATWDDYATVALDHWRAEHEAVAPTLSGHTLASLPRSADEWQPFARDVLGKRARRIEPQRWASVAHVPIGRALVIGLVDRGWTLTMQPGTAPTIGAGGVSFEPFELVARMAAGEIDPVDLDQVLGRLGVGDVPLGDGSQPHPQPGSSERWHRQQAAPATEQPPPSALPRMPVATHPGTPDEQLGVWTTKGGLRSKPAELTANTDGIVHGDQRIPWDDVESFEAYVTVGNGEQVVRVALITADQKLDLARSSMRKGSRQDDLAAFNVYVELIRTYAQPRLLADLLARLGRGDEIAAGSVKLTRAGWKAGMKTRTWDEFHAATLEAGEVRLWVVGTDGKVKAKHSVSAAVTNALLLPELMATWKESRDSVPA